MSLRIPNHIGLIPDGNRRWARERGLHPAEGYAAGVIKGLTMLDECIGLGIKEVSVYGFTMDNNKRPRDQRIAFGAACAKFVEAAMLRDVDLRVVGDWQSKMFPTELRPYALERRGGGKLKVNILVNYGWSWDLQTAVCAQSEPGERRPFTELLASADVSRVDLLVRWGGMRRLSGFLPIQTVYSDFYVVDAYWPDYQIHQFHEALHWYAKQDVTLGG
ncbi:MAG TPA: undecaprenyl diphosphate synthase family protein [Fimbriimonas sp.]|nr:undecaprenyl diphosphate synthase family protein [Fimbriimonas sp.]